VVRALDERPRNANELAEALDLDYTTVRHHLDVLRENNVVTRSGDEYAAVYLLTDQVRDHWDTVEEIVETVVVEWYRNGTLTLTVVEETEGPNGATDRSPTDGAGPGLGALPALGSLAALGYLLARRVGRVTDANDDGGRALPPGRIGFPGLGLGSPAARYVNAKKYSIARLTPTKRVPTADRSAPLPVNRRTVQRSEASETVNESAPGPI
jgi:DNA-binding transcriptional ArsR family regulator